ncbi:MAG: TonB-dependent receptor [Bacteroidales bacterium]
MKTIKLMVMVLIMISPALHAQKSDSMDTLSVWVNGACGMCKDRIESNALKIRGVQSAVWDLSTKTLTIRHNDKFKEDNLLYALASVGHDTRKYTAPDAVYNALPACCHYRTVESHGAELEHGPGDRPGSGPGLKPGTVAGTVFERLDEDVQPLPGTNVYWSGTLTGVTTDAEGRFEIALQPGVRTLVFSFVGLGTDSVLVEEPGMLEVELSNATTLEEVEIVYRRPGTRIELDGAFDLQRIDNKELLKAACCNLSESFETNPSVDASVTDAVTGTRQIEMLGLAGKYVQITQENMPLIRGLSSLNGLGFVPGSWIDGIQLNTGTGSVVNGFESITGQINVELKKPKNGEALYVNLYGNSAGMSEANVNTAVDLNEHLSTGLLVHGKFQPFSLDHNMDGFMDHPAEKSGVFMNRWSWFNDKGLETRFGIKAVTSRTNSGQVAYDPEQNPEDQSAWGAALNTDRLEAFLKMGKVFPDKPFSSVGFQVSGMVHDMDAFFGRRTYTGRQGSLYANLIYQGILGNTNHQYRTGASFQFDDYAETFLAEDYRMREAIPGVFLEYTYNRLDRFTVVSGIRADRHNLYGLFVTPRLHLRYATLDGTVFRAMIGRGQRTPNVLLENLGFLASSREFIFEDAGSGDQGIRMNPEVAWNTGASVAREFNVSGKTALVKLDYYYTWFTNQVIVNLDRRTDAVIFQSLDGPSHSHSLQAQVNYEWFRNFNTRLAYRFNEVTQSIDGTMLSQAMTPRNRAFLNVSYETAGRWMFDATLTWQGAKRIPDTRMNPEEFQLDAFSPDYFLVNSQISKSFGGKFDVYAGAENLLDFRQDSPILDAANPFGDNFDASLIWGPVFGRKSSHGKERRKISKNGTVQLTDKQ